MPTVVLGVGTSGWRFGLVFAAWGVGGILVAVLTPRLLRVTSPNRLSLLWLPVAGVAGVVVATTTTWAGGRRGEPGSPVSRTRPRPSPPRRGHAATAVH